MSTIERELKNPARGVLRCAIYIRVSTAMQALEGWSLDAQRASLSNFAKKRGWKVVGIYADEGKSARKRLKNRTEIHKLLEVVKQGGIDVILFKDLDRWFRSVSDFYKVQDILDQYGVRWVSEQQPDLDMNTNNGRLNVNILLSVGQNEADVTSARIKYTNKYMREQRRWNAGGQTLPRGYMVDDDQHVVIDPEWEPYVRAAIDRVMRYGSMRRALIETNEEFNQEVFYNNFVSLLRNPLLCGEYKGADGFVDKPYLTKEEFKTLQERTARNIRNTPNRLYIFGGRVKCAECGWGMTGSLTINSMGKPYMYYRCKKAHTDHQCTNKMRVNEKKMEAYLLEFVKDAVAERIATVKAIHQERKTRKPRKSNRAAIDRQLDKLEDIYISSDRMTKERYEEKKAAILAKLIEDEEPIEAEPQLASLEQIQALFDSGIEKIYKDFTPEERREFWLKIIREIRVKDGQIVGVDFIE